MENKDLTFYRYEAIQYASLDTFGEYETPKLPNPSLVLHTYKALKETPKGYWINYGILNKNTDRGKWVSKTAKKRFAYPTKEDALNNFITRTKKRIKILKYQTTSCIISVSKAESILKNIKNE